ncbi:MAG: helix-turn-helix transcriptional regulator [Candidatus Desulforudis sp.]|nr:helix-turn-helix transcriptional regulator [Desulforudis sp.]
MNNRLREFRSEAGLTQEQLADRLGVSRQTVISIENGRYNPSLILAYKIARAFSYRIEDVFDFSEVDTDG